jgi:hypothetical protein
MIEPHLVGTLELTDGERVGAGGAKALIERLPVEVVIADKGYDSRAVVEEIEAQGAELPSFCPHDLASAPSSSWLPSHD